MRIGNGYDFHRLVEGRQLVLGGIEIPYHLGLLGHSDADLLTHAITDALLGAACLGDIGQHFPPGEPRWKNVSSLLLLSKVLELVREKHYRPVNVDAVVVAERPKLAPHIPAMRTSLSSALDLPLDRVSVKATTSEGLGPIGEGLAMACYAVVLLEEEAK
ncbi:2-C-methyl-D-erythritol 2,4-cyclodiphosphate synthase [Gloeobacter kilaueensis]|uniref:2-C-methyl-D-erythritol 2,4-cyclodiphosphate synthase n=1 Tax=Gloeobacter kilaueensis (strain ATCC BAA-2537 / CCAP 1431/1 / ULC 316 / JS1) TaxID=1183438 RepID=U5QPD3_GLOK1|nr:2-C-methyl-D-erythritol 2,4-cyclodiphosphate synthase [Gloeobacter kilaueensis]AGY59535.1 2-C-methyl-D-erythritol 2,4-cyclodiphosphate synthase [Gloeobacter kilaueensis JS1]